MFKPHFRPKGYEGSVEEHLPRVQNAIAKAITQAQKGFTYDTLRLDRPSLKALAAILTEFAEDLHCEIGIWQNLERANTEFFGTPLPFQIEPRTAFPQVAISTTRLLHFLSGGLSTVHSRSAPQSNPHRPGSCRASRRRSLTREVRQSPQGLGNQAFPADSQQVRLGSQTKAGLARHRVVLSPGLLPAVHWRAER